MVARLVYSNQGARVKCVYASVRLASKPTGKLRLKYASSGFRRNLFDQRRHLFELKYLEALSFRRNVPRRTHFYRRTFQTQFTRWLRRKTHFTPAPLSAQYQSPTDAIGTIPEPYRRYRRYTRALPALSAQYQSPTDAIGTIPEPYRRYRRYTRALPGNN